MSTEDDEFKDVEKGLPAENTAQKSSIKFLLVFLIGGVLISVVVTMFGNALQSAMGPTGHIVTQMLMNGSVSLILGSLQAWIFKSKIRSRVSIFILFSLLGGIAGGLIGGLLLSSGLEIQAIIGAVNGILAGGISSLAQNKLMGNKKYGSQWFFYNAISWALIYAIAWPIGQDPENLTSVAVAGSFLMVASGISLVIFLRNTPQIEFS